MHCTTPTVSSTRRYPGVLVTDDQLDDITDYACSLYPNPEDRVDWDDFLFRVEQVLDIDLPESMLDPVIVRIKKAVRQARKEAAQ